MVSYDDIIKAVSELLEDRGISLLTKIRHNGVVFEVGAGNGSRKFLKVSRGVIQGDTLGPLAFLLVYHAFLFQHKATKDDDTIADLISKVRPFDPRGKCFQAAEVTVDLSDVVYADDHSAFFIFDSMSMATEFLTCLFNSQLAYHFPPTSKNQSCCCIAQEREPEPLEKGLESLLTYKGMALSKLLLKPNKQAPSSPPKVPPFLTCSTGSS